MRPVALLLAALALTAVASGPRAIAAEEEAAVATATTLVDEAYDALSSSAQPEEERMAALQGAIDAAFAFDIWRRFLLDPLEDDLSEEERTTAEGLLPGYLANLYRTNFERGLESAPAIGGTRAARRDLLVEVDFPRANGATLPTEWRIRDFDERGHLVIDIMVGGASFLRLKRDEFAAIVQQGGGDGLIAHLRENNVAAASPAD